MISSTSSARVRAGMLVLALALIGGLGCAAIGTAGNARYESQQQAFEAQRVRSVAELTPAAEAGDPAAMVLLAQAMLSPRSQGSMPEALDWLSRAAARNDGPAQALLGDVLASGHVSFGSFVTLPEAWRDRARGLDLLRKAASQACRFKLPAANGRPTLIIEPALKLADYLRVDGEPVQARVWHARSVVHCGSPGADHMASILTKLHPRPEAQVELFSLLLLLGDAAAIVEASPSLTPENRAAAAREAAGLRSLLAESERRYPAPKHKELP